MLPLALVLVRRYWAGPLGVRLLRLAQPMPIRRRSTTLHRRAAGENRSQLTTFMANSRVMCPEEFVSDGPAPGIEFTNGDEPGVKLKAKGKRE